MTAAVERATIEHVYELQGSLFACDDAAIDPTFAGLTRVELDDACWIDHLPGWLHGSDGLFVELRDRLSWTQRRVVMWDRLVDEPRLVWWRVTSEVDAEPVPVLTSAREALVARYGRVFRSIGVNYYRDGADSVAWHGDRERFRTFDTVIAIVSLGAPRPFVLRPRVRDLGGVGCRSRRYELGHGDLLVMGGACQNDWEHAVPKVAQAGPRISVTFREGTIDGVTRDSAP